MGIRRIFRQAARPFEAIGQGTKHFFTGPEYDKIAGDVNAEAQATGQTEFGATAPRGPVGPSMPSVGNRSSMGYQQPKGTFSGGKQPGGTDWTKVLPHKADGSVDWLRAAELGLVVGSAVEGWRASRKGDKLAEEAINMERERNAAMQPVRDQALAALMAGKKQTDLSYLTDQTNPYRKPMRTVGGS